MGGRRDWCFPRARQVPMLCFPHGRRVPPLSSAVPRARRALPRCRFSAWRAAASDAQQRLRPSLFPCGALPSGRLALLSSSRALLRGVRRRCRKSLSTGLRGLRRSPRRACSRGVRGLFWLLLRRSFPSLPALPFMPPPSSRPLSWHSASPCRGTSTTAARSGSSSWRPSRGRGPRRSSS